MATITPTPAPATTAATATGTGNPPPTSSSSSPPEQDGGDDKTNPSPSSSSPPQQQHHHHRHPATQTSAPTVSTEAVLKRSANLPPGARVVRGVDFNEYADSPITVVDLVRGMATMGFQASAVAEAVRIIEGMRTWRDPETSEKTTILLGYTSNLISSGLRETLRYLAQHSHISAIVTTAGGIEEDLIKCLAPTYLHSFTATPGEELRRRGLNRVGDLLVPNDNYCAFEDWVMPILDRMLAEQEASRADPTVPPEEKLVWTPSTVTRRLGLEINDETSVLHWAARNDIPVFCPALTDGSLGDMLYFHTFRASPRRLAVDVVADIRALNTLAVRAARVGMIVLGGGVVKHHIANACLMRNGAEAAVFVNSGVEWDGSDAGARPDEAVSWGKVKSVEEGGEMVKVWGEATVVWPLIVAATFARPLACEEGREGEKGGGRRGKKEGEESEEKEGSREREAETREKEG